MALLLILAFLGVAHGGVGPAALHHRDQSIQWPEQLADPGWRPRIGYLRESTGIEGQLLIGPKVEWHGPSGSVTWTLLDAPSGMRINQGHRIIWPEPKEGRYLVRARAEVNGETEEADWMLNVLKTGFPNPVIFSTRHIDYIVPASEAEWMESAGIRKVVDAYYEFGRDLVGGLSIDARQSILYDPGSGGAHSGIPIVAGPDPFGDSDVTRWRLGFLWHELAHNFNPMLRCELVDDGNDVISASIHGMVEFDKTAWVRRLLLSPESFGVADLSHFEEWNKIDAVEFNDGFDRYMQAGPSAPGLLDWKDGSSGVWVGMVHEYGLKYGGAAVEKIVRAFRRDGLALADYPDNMSVTDKFTAIMCVMSNAVGHDIRDEFRSMRMPLNDKFYVKFNAAVAQTMAHLPEIGKNGAVKCPADGHYYVVTPYATTWVEAESTARRLGGHLATIRSAAQEQWLANKYGRSGWLWLGARRNSQDGSWHWVTGETPGSPVWEPERPEADPLKTCMVLINHEDQPRVEWFGTANRPPDEKLIGLVEFERPPAFDADSL